MYIWWLNNNELLAKYTNKFTSKVCDLFEEKKSFEPIYNAIEKSNHRKVELIKIPYWYLRISAKQILLRNLKLSSLIKAIFQFRIIFAIIKNSSFLTKFLIVLESIINTLWYSFTFTLKSKKWDRSVSSLFCNLAVINNIIRDNLAPVYEKKVIYNS